MTDHSALTKRLIDDGLKQPERDGSLIDLSPAADLARLLRALEKVERFVGPPLVRSIAGLHSGGDRLLVVKSHRWKAFTEVARKIRERQS